MEAISTTSKIVYHLECVEKLTRLVQKDTINLSMITMPQKSIDLDAHHKGHVQTVPAGFSLRKWLGMIRTTPGKAVALNKRETQGPAANSSGRREHSHTILKCRMSKEFQ